MRLKLISCEVFKREIDTLARKTPHRIEAEFLPLRMHDRGGKAMSREIQARIDAADVLTYDAILLGYALCGNGVIGLRAANMSLVVPRAHDCIALLMGSRHDFQRYFETHSGVFYRSPGWIEHGAGDDSLHGSQIAFGLNSNLDVLLEKYGEENGRYIYEQMTSSLRHYTQLTYIRTGVEPDGEFEAQARVEASERKWSFETYMGNLRLFNGLLMGDWGHQDFLVVQPGQTIRASDGSLILEAQ